MSEVKRWLNRSFLLLFCAIVAGVLPAQVQGQVKYDPEHPEVQEMIDRGIKYLEAHGARGYPETLLYGIAAYKAGLWSSAAPKDHPLVQEGSQAAQQVGADFAGRADFNSMYVPALTVIFLLDIDSEQYETEIQNILDYLISQQQQSGAWGYVFNPANGDTSQMQYIGLALWLASKSGFDVDPLVGRDALDWMVRNQHQSGGWIYTIPPIKKIGIADDTEIRHSLVAAGAGTVYILAEWLQLATRQTAAQRRSRETERLAAELEIRLPTSVSRYDPEAPEVVLAEAKVDYDVSRMRAVMARSNNWFRSNYRPDPQKWTYYYLYAFERYASLRELVDGDVAGLGNWYDRGVDYLKSIQRSDGSWPTPATGENDEVSTCLAILFLTRSMQLSINAKVEGLLEGGEGFPEGELRRGADGQLIGASVEKDINQLLILMDDPNNEELDEFVKQMKNLTVSSEGTSRVAQLSKLRRLVTDRRYQLRKIAVDLLGQQRELDNVPALLYALTDPDLEIAQSANRGLRFISRKIESLPMSEKPDKSELRRLKEAWTDWYLSIRPGAQLLDDPVEGDN